MRPLSLSISGAVVDKVCFQCCEALNKSLASRLGHPSMIIVQRVLNNKKLPFSKESSSIVVCDACQCAKSHHLPFPTSSSVSKAPLKLVFLDVWGPAPSSVSKHSYYVSFIDDYSKST
jgi:hypothetical protein